MRFGFAITLLLLATVTLGPAAAEGPAPAPLEALHRVEPGDFLFLIAGYYYNDPNQWERIYRANRDRIKNPHRIEKGLVLRIPLPPDWEPRAPYQEWKARFLQKQRDAAAVKARPSPLEAAHGRYRLRLLVPAGYTEKGVMTINGQVAIQENGEQGEASFGVRAQTEMRVNTVTPDGLYDVSTRIFDVQVDGKQFDLAAIGISRDGTQRRHLVNRRLEVIKELKGPTSSTFEEVTYPPGPLKTGDSWDVNRIVTEQGATMRVTTRYTLAGRETFQDQEVLRIVVTTTVRPADKMPEAQVTMSGEGHVLVSLANGSILHQEMDSRIETALPSQQAYFKVTMRAVLTSTP
ncbi:MAG: hypothetical protein ACE5HK_06310 [Candidatus Methylomirabilales bacterium]